jgi:hypothetical protein
MQAEKLKLESRNYGFDFLNNILTGECSLEYGQLGNGLIHKYKLLNVSGARFDELLAGHINSEYNICCYFQESANSVCCFNLDNNFKDYDYNELAAPIPEVQGALEELTGLLRELGLVPLVLVSGRGYHLWLRFEEAIPNQQLFEFSIRVAAKTLRALHEGNLNYNKVKFSVYPNPQIIHTGSLRLFGSRHVQSKVFSHVLQDAELLDETASWSYFAAYLKEQTLPIIQFGRARDQIARFFDDAQLTG